LYEATIERANILNNLLAKDLKWLYNRYVVILVSIENKVRN